MASTGVAPTPALIMTTARSPARSTNEPRGAPASTTSPTRSAAWM